MENLDLENLYMEIQNGFCSMDEFLEKIKSNQKEKLSLKYRSQFNYFEEILKDSKINIHKIHKIRSAQEIIQNLSDVDFDKLFEVLEIPIDFEVGLKRFELSLK